MRVILSTAIICALKNDSQVSAEITEPVSEPKYVQFFEWMKENGAKFDGIELRKESEAMRGVYATQDFKEDEELLFVPDVIIPSYEKALQSEIG